MGRVIAIGTTAAGAVVAGTPTGVWEWSGARWNRLNGLQADFGEPLALTLPTTRSTVIVLTTTGLWTYFGSTRWVHSSVPNLDAIMQAGYTPTALFSLPNGQLVVTIGTRGGLMRGVDLGVSEPQLVGWPTGWMGTGSSWVTLPPAIADLDLSGVVRVSNHWLGVAQGTSPVQPQVWQLAGEGHFGAWAPVAGAPSGAEILGSSVGGILALSGVQANGTLTSAAPPSLWRFNGTAWQHLSDDGLQGLTNGSLSRGTVTDEGVPVTLWHVQGTGLIPSRTTAYAYEAGRWRSLGALPTAHAPYILADGANGTILVAWRGQIAEAGMDGGWRTLGSRFADWWPRLGPEAESGMSGNQELSFGWLPSGQLVAVAGGSTEFQTQLREFDGSTWQPGLLSLQREITAFAKASTTPAEYDSALVASVSLLRLPPGAPIPSTAKPTIQDSLQWMVNGNGALLADDQACLVVDLPSGGQCESGVIDSTWVDHGQTWTRMPAIPAGPEGFTWPPAWIRGTLTTVQRQQLGAFPPSTLYSSRVVEPMAWETTIAPNGELTIGTNYDGMFVLRAGAWLQLQAPFVHDGIDGFAFGPAGRLAVLIDSGALWYGVPVQ